MLVSDNGGGVGGLSASVGWMVFGRGGSASAISGVQHFINYGCQSLLMEVNIIYLFREIYILPFKKSLPYG